MKKIAPVWFPRDSLDHGHSRDTSEMIFSLRYTVLLPQETPHSWLQSVPKLVPLKCQALTPSGILGPENSELTQHSAFRNRNPAGLSPGHWQRFKGVVL